MAVKEKPQTYHFLSWHDLLAHRCSCQVVPLVEKLRSINSGVLPPVAKSEVILRIFADACGIRLADPDVEPFLIFPHRLYASREWVRNEYLKFVGFCRATGWAKRTGRPKGTLPGRPGPDEPIWPTVESEQQNQEETANADELLQPAPDQAVELAGE